MKVERLNDNQMKVIMSARDMADRNLSFSELCRGTDKGRVLFSEILAEMRASYSFEFDDEFPIIVEVTQSPKSEVTLVITQIPSGCKARQAGRALGKAGRHFGVQRRGAAVAFKFESLDDATEAAERFGHAAPCYDGVNMLHKLDGDYFLVIKRDDGISDMEFASGEKTLLDFGQRVDSGTLARAFLVEHGELILKQPIQKLCRFV